MIEDRERGELAFADDELMLAGDAAARLGVNPATLSNYSRVGVLPYVRYGPNGWKRYRRQDVERLRANVVKNGGE